MRVRVTTNDSLYDIERKVAEGLSWSAGQFELNFGKAVGNQFFKDAWIAAHLATAFRSIGSESVSATPSEPLDSMPHEFVAFTKYIFSNAHLLQSPESTLKAQEPLRALRESGGVLEVESTGKALTICALDPVLPSPFVLGVSGNPVSYVDDFRSLKRRLFEVGDAAKFSERAPDSDRSIAEFVYELFENTLSHGRLDAKDNVLAGIRYLRLKRHIAHKASDFVDRAHGFPELQGYVKEVAPLTGTFTFLEISIGDSGIGLVDRFVSTRPEVDIARLTKTKKTRLGVVNHIMINRLSSKKNKEGAGGGLTNMVTAARKLRGFLTLRTGSDWACRDFSTGASESIALTSVVMPRSLPKISGTHYGLLIPLSAS